MSYLELVVNQNKKHYQCIYEGKSNYMYTFWCAFYFFLESYSYEEKLSKYPLILKARPLPCVREKQN